MIQNPVPGDFLLRWRGDRLTVTLTLGAPRAGRAALRTNIGRASVRRREIIDATERGLTPQARAWTDIPLAETAPGVFSAEIPLDEVGVFSGKACFFPADSSVPEWPEGRNFHVKVESAETRKNNSIYCIFPRQFGSFREVIRRLPLIMDRMGFRIVQTLPPFPVPTTYAVMGEYGCPFAATDFLSVDPAMAEFDARATPLDQFRELIGAVHAKSGLFFIDLPANHTGWASTLQTHHPDWFRHETDGRFHSPGAWGVTWADLVELDYSNAQLRAYMAQVFLFWCRIGVDGFRCDAGYMIPAETWEYIVACVREEYPDTIFMLEGLGGKLEVTDRLLAESNLDWAYSEIFQTYDRGQFEWYLPTAIARAEKFGTLVHFAETHDNDRLAKGGAVYARLRVQLAALLSWQGAWGIANGVEWYCREKIDVHGKNDLNWGAEDNMVDLIGRLNALLDTNPSFTGNRHFEVVTRGDGNTLAVLRCGDPAKRIPSALVLANLDCANGCTIDWDRRRFSYDEAVDVLTGDRMRASGAIILAPGEVRCLQPAETVALNEAERSLQAVRDGIDLAFENTVRRAGEILWHWRYPRDARRDVVVPEGQWIEVSAPTQFRLRLIDADSGKTVRVYRSSGCKVVFDAPHYHGDGTRCRTLELHMTAYADGKAVRTHSRFLVPPPADAARVRLTLSGADVRRQPDARTVLSNGAGAAAQLRLGWGEIRSQYDAVLAANPNPEVPSDRINIWTRTRCWLQREGYVRELDKWCVTAFTADPAGRFARWRFRVPCGMGKETGFVFTQRLVPDANVAVLEVERVRAPAEDVEDQVRLVFRPDLEWRSYHATTKAYRDGTERLFNDAARPLPDGRGVRFAPYGKESFELDVANGVYHHEPLWTYSADHSEEAARGQDGAGDLFSPGWVSADLRLGDRLVLTGRYARAGERPAAVAPLVTAASADRLPIADALRQAINLFIVRRNDLKTVIAGYPWFLDWGRDTFIFMRGMIAAGLIADSLKILQAFAAFEEKGTLPNIIYGETAGNRDTTDAPLWFVRCVAELAATGAVGEAEIAALRQTCESIADNYIAGTPNGIRVDAASGLVWSPSHFTWMDTNYPACTPRVGYPVEIQALWISALRYLGRDELADRATASVERLFKLPAGGYADCLDAPNGEGADAARPDGAIRPNQLLLVTLGVLSDPSVLTATEGLLTPGGIRSLDPADGRYRGVYAGDEDTSRKPAYHNGTVWAWQFPLYAEALVALGKASGETARQLLAGAVEQLNAGCIGHVSEVADGDSPHAQKGCTAQAWSASELLRVWFAVER